MNKRFKKILKLSFWLLASLVLLFTVSSYFLLKYRLKETLQYVVSHETNGCYELKIGFSSYQFWEDQIVLKNLTLKNKKCFDKATQSIHIKRVYLKLDAIYPLLFGQDYHIDQLKVDGIDFSIQLKKKGKKINLKSEIEHVNNVLATIGGKFHMENIFIKNANVQFLLKGKQFKLKHIRLSINQFSKNQETNRFDAVFNMKLNHQRIVLKNNLIEFDQLLLNNNRGLQLSNFKFIQPSSQLKGKYNVFKTKRFHFLIEQDFFQNEDLIIDSLYLKNVEVKFQLVKGGVEQNIDSVQRQFHPTSVFEIFNNVGIKQLKLIGLKLTFPKNDLHSKKIAISQRSLLIQDLVLNEKTGLSCKRLKLLNDQITIQSPKTQQQIRLSEFAFKDNTISLIKPQLINSSGSTISTIKVSKIKFIELDITKALDLDFQAKRIQIISPQFVNKINRSKELNVDLNVDQINSLFIKGVHQIANYFKSDKIELYNGFIDVSNQNKHILIKQLDLVFDTKKLIACKSLFELQKNVERLSVGSLFFDNGVQQLNVNNTKLFFLEKNYRVGYLKLKSRKITAEINDLNISHFDIEEYFNNQSIKIGKFDVEKLDLKLTENKNTVLHPIIPLISIDTLFIHKTHFSLYKNKEKQVGFEIDSTVFNGLDYHSSTINWKESDAKARRIFINNFNNAIDLEVGTLKMKNKHLTLRAINLRNKLENNEIDVDVPALLLDLKTTGISNNHLNFAKLTFPKSSINVDFAKLPQKRKQGDQLSKKALKLPQIDIDHIAFEDISLMTSFDNKSVQMKSDFLLNMHLKDVHLDPVLLTKDVQNKFNKLPLTYKLDCMLEGSLKEFTYQDINSSIEKITVQSRSTLDQDNVQKILSDPVLLADFLKGNLQGFSTIYNQHSIHFNEVFWRSQKEQIQINGISVVPIMSSNQHFKNQSFESLYFKIINGNMNLNQVSIAEIVKEHKFHFKSIDLENIEIALMKDKTKPFEKGNIKPMFTDLLMNNRFDFDIDVINFKNIHIPYEEKHDNKNESIQMDFSKLNGKISNVKSHPSMTDSLSIDANLYFNDIYINHFFYRESYLDTLSAFRMRLALGKTDLRKLSSISKPLASIQILSGFCDTLATTITGNKMAAYGYMYFKYRDLSVHLDSNERIKSPVMLNLINFTANDFLLNKQNDKPSFVFTERNTDKYIINLWIKSILSGLFTSTGIKTNRSYYKKIKKNREKYYL